MIRMLIIGYCMGIRSERRLCEVHLNLACRWLRRLGLEGDVPGHSTFWQEPARPAFGTVICYASCSKRPWLVAWQKGLVGGEGFAAGASLIKADANRQRCVPGSEGLPPGAANHAVREYLAVLDDAAFGAAAPVTPKVVSPADPASRWTAAHGRLAFFACSTNYLII